MINWWYKILLFTGLEKLCNWFKIFGLYAQSNRHLSARRWGIWPKFKKKCSASGDLSDFLSCDLSDFFHFHSIYVKKKWFWLSDIIRPKSWATWVVINCQCSNFEKTKWLPTNKDLATSNFLSLRPTQIDFT